MIFKKLDRETVDAYLDYLKTAMQDGCKMAYVDWVYVLSAHRHKGVAQALFKEFEKECRDFGINHYYLIRSERPEPDRFYHAFADVELTREPLLRKCMS